MESVDFIKAAYNGDAEKIGEFLKTGINVNEKDDHGVTALMAAAANGHCNILNMLLEKGADVNEKSIEGGTALLLASERGNTNIVKILMDKGADVNAKDVEGHSALDCATINGHENIVKLLGKETTTSKKTFWDRIFIWILAGGLTGWIFGGVYAAYIPREIIGIGVVLWGIARGIISIISLFIISLVVSVHGVGLLIFILFLANILGNVSGARGGFTGFISAMIEFLNIKYGFMGALSGFIIGGMFGTIFVGFKKLLKKRD